MRLCHHVLDVLGLAMILPSENAPDRVMLLPSGRDLALLRIFLSGNASDLVMMIYLALQRPRLLRHINRYQRRGASNSD
eukprot:8209130-Prorocentrum_lima.AAC.1